MSYKDIGKWKWLSHLTKCAHKTNFLGMRKTKVISRKACEFHRIFLSAEGRIPSRKELQWVVCVCPAWVLRVMPRWQKDRKCDITTRHPDTNSRVRLAPSPPTICTHRGAEEANRKQQVLAEPETLEHLCFIDGSVKWCGHCGKKDDSSSRN